MKLSPNRRWIVGEFTVMLTIWVFAFANVFFTEWLNAPQWQGRAFWSSLPALILLTWPLARLPRLFFVEAILSVQGDRLVSRASMWRDFECPLIDIQEVQSVRRARSIAGHFTVIKTVDNRSHWIMDRYVDRRFSSAVRAQIRAALHP